jgi:hypothetical protein
MHRSVILLALACSGCAAAPPPNWAAGGARVTVPSARWLRGDTTYDIRPDGKVLADGDAVFAIDAAGRVFETDGESVAVLQADGHLVGRDNAAMGTIGPVSATFPGSDHAWFTIGTNGQVVRFDGEAPATPDGAWMGCQGPASRTCTLVTHLVLLREVQRRPHVGVGIGFGMGFGVIH